MRNYTIETSDWLTKGISNEQLKTEKALAVISAKIYTKRIEMDMDQKAFANFMGVSQGMISKWESGTYNFTISTLIGICEKMDLNFDPQIYDKVLTPQNTEFVSKKRKNLDVKKWVDWTPGDRVNLEKGVA